MKFTLSWLKDHLDTTASLDEIATKLSAIGLEVEGIDDPAKKLGAFTVARVLETKQHPNADRLRVAQVEIAKGKATVEVVCGAANCHAGMLACSRRSAPTFPAPRSRWRRSRCAASSPTACCAPRRNSNSRMIARHHRARRRGFRGPCWRPLYRCCRPF